MHQDHDKGDAQDSHLASVLRQGEDPEVEPGRAHICPSLLSMDTEANGPHNCILGLRIKS